MRLAASPLRPAARSSGPGRSAFGLAFAIPFGLIFIVAGCAIVWSMALRPILRSVSSHPWPAVEATVISSELASKRASKGGMTYRIDIRYRYAWPDGNAQQLIGERYDFSSNGYTNIGVSDMRAIVAAHPVGKRITCYVNPADPTIAVIDRGIPFQSWFGCAFLSFVAGGAGVIGASVYSARKRRKAAIFSGNAFPRPDARAGASGEIELAKSESKLGAVAVMGGVAFFWNSIVSVFVLIAVKNFGEDGFEGWFLPIFLIPFVLIGAALLAGFVHNLSQAFGPTTRLWLLSGEPAAGVPHGFRWRITRKAHRIRRLQISLVLREESTRRQGKNTTIERAELVREILVDTADPRTLAEGGGVFEIPRNLPPSLPASANRLIWELVVHGEVPRGADLHEAFVLPVRSSVEAPATRPPAEIETHAGETFSLLTPRHAVPGNELVFTLRRETASAPKRATVRVGWFTHGAGMSDADVVWSSELPDMPAGESREYRVPLPETPWSFAGSLIEVRWQIEVAGRWNRPIVSAPLVVSPTGAPVRLPAPLPRRETPKLSWWKRASTPRNG